MKYKFEKVSTLKIGDKFISKTGTYQVEHIYQDGHILALPIGIVTFSREEEVIKIGEED